MKEEFKLDKMLKIELSRALKNKYFLFSIIIGCMLAITHVAFNVLPLYGDVDLPKGAYPHSVFNKWIGGQAYAPETFLFFLIAPMLATIVYGTSFYVDMKSGYIKNVFIRTEKRYYYVSKYVATFISGGLVIIIPLILNFYLTSMLLPSIIPEASSGTFPIFENFMWNKLYYSQPYIYVFLYIILDFIFYGLIATIALAISFNIDNQFAVMVAPFLYYMVFSFVLSATNKGEFNPLFFLQPSQPQIGISFTNVLIEVVILFCITAGIFTIKGVKNDTF